MAAASVSQQQQKGLRFRRREGHQQEGQSAAKGGRAAVSLGDTAAATKTAHSTGMIKQHIDRHHVLKERSEKKEKGRKE